MDPVIRFRSRLFDVSTEPENPINPIRGASLLDWLRTRMPAEVTMTDTEAEDWGWYVDLDWHGRRYMLGASAESGEDGMQDWALQIEKLRSFKEKLMGQAKMTAEDPVLAHLRSVIGAEAGFVDVVIED
jgi:hypothetical protein